MNDQRRLAAFLRSLDNGADVVTIAASRADPSAADGAQDCEEALAARGHSDDGVWLFWDRVAHENAFARGALVAPLTIWWRGDRDRCRRLLAGLPDPYELGFDEGLDAFVVTRPSLPGDDDLPDPRDQRKVLVRIGRIEEATPAEAAWLDEVLAHGSTKARLAVLHRHVPVSRAARDGALADLKALAKGDVSTELAVLLRGLDEADDPRLDATVDTLLGMRGWAPRAAAVHYLVRRRDDPEAERTLRRLLAAKSRDSTEPVIGGVATLVHLLALRDGRPPLDVAHELMWDDTLGEGSRNSAEEVASHLRNGPVGPDDRALVDGWVAAHPEAGLSYDPGDWAMGSAGATLVSDLRTRWSGPADAVEAAVADLPDGLFGQWCGPDGQALVVSPDWERE